MKTLLKGRGYWDDVDNGYSDLVDWNALRRMQRRKRSKIP